MLAVHPQTMYHGAGRPDPARPHGQHHQSSNFSNPGPSTNGYPRSIELPRLPLEPRPYPSLSPSDPSGAYRPSGFSLPGFKDIFSTASPAPGPGPAPSTFSTPWSTPGGSASNFPARDSRHNYQEGHAPLALSHAPDVNTSPHGGPERRLDMRGQNHSPIARAPAHSLPTSPYATFPESREHAEARPERLKQASTMSYVANGAPSPYTPGTNEDTQSQFTSPTTAYERAANTPFSAPAGPECQKMYLGVKEIPGEGRFHLYDGGYRIPTQIDGEQVNPAWGLTKANKPRKRLALACLDCREKKIKCEPGANSCVQCEKAKRTCRRAPNQAPSSDSATPATWSSTAGSPPHNGTSDPNSGSRNSDIEPAHKRRAHEETSPPYAPSKKHRSTSPPMQYGRAVSVLGGHVGKSGTPVGSTFSTDRGYPLSSWEEDPYTADQETTLHLLDLYLMHLNNATVCIFPRRTFWHWTKSCQHKSERELMVLNAVLAVGSIFADERYTSAGDRFAQAAAEAVLASTGVSDLFAVQARLLLALFHSSRGSAGKAWDLTGAALRAATHISLRINVDDEDAEDERCRQDARAEESADARAKTHFSFSRPQYHECRRRTFWAVFLRDRFSPGTLCAINLQDIHLRLPNTDDMYERSLRSEAPFYNNGIVEPLDARISPTSPVCPAGWLVQVAAVWGDVLNFTNRSVHRGASNYRASYDTFYSETYNRLEDWTSRLPEYLQYSQSNIERSIRGGYADTFITMHAVYHFVFMKLNRYVRHSIMRDSIPRNIRAAHWHAQRLLAMMTSLRSANCEGISPLTGQQCDFFPSTPFVGTVTMAAIDIVGAGGLDSNLKAAHDAIDGGLGCLVVLARYWNSAKELHRESQKRYYQILNMVHQPFKARSGCWLGREWGMIDPLEKEFDLRDDCIYGATEESGKPNELYFNALKGNVQDEKATPHHNGNLRMI